MAFRFPLETLLRLRRVQEQSERLKLEAIISEQLQTHARLEEVIDRSVESRRRFQRDLAGGLTGSELQFQGLRHANAASLRAALQGRLLQLEQSRVAQLHVFYGFRQRREVLENLRRRKLEDYDLQLSRREQQELDDIFLMRQEIVRAESK